MLPNHSCARPGEREFVCERVHEPTGRIDLELQSLALACQRRDHADMHEREAGAGEREPMGEVDGAMIVGVTFHADQDIVIHG